MSISTKVVRVVFHNSSLFITLVQGKKLPPLAAINVGANKSKHKKDLNLVKAPILQNTTDSQKDSTARAATNKNLNETNSEIDIKDSNNWDKHNKVPSYNPRLLKQENNENYNLFSLQSNDFAENEPKFIEPNNENTEGEQDLNNLLADLNDDEPHRPPKEWNKRTSENGTTHVVNSLKANEKFNSHDSFEDLMDELDEPKKEGPPGMAQVHIIKQNNYDDFTFK